MKKLMFTISFAIFLITFSYMVYAEGEQLLCLTYGENANLSEGQPEYICEVSSCQLCVRDYPSGNRFAIDPNICSGLGLVCESSGGEGIDKYPPEITVLIPEDGFVSSRRGVEFDIQMNELSTLYYLDSQEERRGFRRLYSNTQRFTRTISLKEGYHNLTFKAVDGSDNEGFESIEIYVDSKEPRIKETLPEEGYVNTIFTIKYNEDNLQSVILHYRQGGDWIDVVLENCPSGKDQTCSSEDILLDDGEVKYYFTISDFAISVNSDVISLMVDTVDPVITINDPQSVPYNTKKIPFDIDLSEDVEILEYLDAADLGGKWKRLCKNCDGYYKSKSFGEGYHDLIIRATDYAGNGDEVYIGFTVDSKDPRIKRIEPRKGKYGNGTFYIKYQEDNLQSISLFYKEGSELTYTEVSKTDCPSGKNAECYFYVSELEGVEQGDYSYYFIVYDLATDVQSKIYNFILDSVAPEFTKVDKTIDGRKVYFDIELSEKSTLEYMDDFDSRPRFKRLCSNCVSYDRRKTFKSGDHALTLRATDKAGNVNEAEMSFTID